MTEQDKHQDKSAQPESTKKGEAAAEHKTPTGQKVGSAGNAQKNQPKSDKSE